MQLRFCFVYEVVCPSDCLFSRLMCPYIAISAVDNGRRSQNKSDYTPQVKLFFMVSIFPESHPLSDSSRNSNLFWQSRATQVCRIFFLKEGVDLNEHVNTPRDERK